MRPGRTLLYLFFAYLSGSASRLLRAQAPTPPPENPAYVLHLDSRMAQVPTLFLSTNRHPVPHLDPQHINISLDGHSPFHPSHIRLEGDDPITLAILLDVSGSVSDLLPAFSKDFSAWVSSALKPQDHLSIYAVDCSIFQTDNYQASSPATLQHDLDTAINSPLPHGKKGRPACGNSIRLRDSMSTIMGQLTQLPGRRVLLVITDGYDGASIRSWDDLKNDAADRDVSVFGMNPTNAQFFELGMPFFFFTQHTGGVSFQTSPQFISRSMPAFIKLLRERAILEFPMSASFSGHHVIEVTMDHSDARILPAGFAIVPISDSMPPVTPPQSDTAPTPNLNH